MKKSFFVSAFHELGLVFEPTHRSCFLFLRRYPATAGAVVGFFAFMLLNVHGGEMAY